MINTKKCNNNVILAVDNGQEVIALGKGIGFNTRPGDEVDISLVEKVFVPKEASHIDHFKDILTNLPYEIIMLSGKIVDFGKSRLDRPLNQSIVIALADHLNFSITRLKEQMDIEIPLVWDIKHIYPLEFAIGRESLDIIKQEISVDFPDAEASAIALHFINAESDYSDMSNTIKISGVIKKSIEIVETHYKTVINDSTPDFNGFVTLLRNTFIRILYHEDKKNPEEDTELYELLHKRYSFALDCAEKTSLFIEKEHSWKLTKNDVSLLTLYINRMSLHEA